MATMMIGDGNQQGLEILAMMLYSSSPFHETETYPAWADVSARDKKPYLLQATVILKAGTVLIVQLSDPMEGLPA